MCVCVRACAFAQVQYGDALKLAPEPLRADFGVVLAAVRNDGNALEFASLDLRDDRTVRPSFARRSRDRARCARGPTRRR